MEMPKSHSLIDKDIRLKLFEILEAEHPNPKSELNFGNPFELLCAVVLSAQATDVSVNKITGALFQKAPNAAAMSALGEEKIGEIIRSIGLWRAKARHLAQLSAILERDFEGKVPDDYESLLSLPGVGSKTAKVVLNVAFHQPLIAVDTHIFRVCCRTGLCVGKSPAEVEKYLPPLVDDRFKQNAHHYLLLHGRYVCKARTPNCDACSISAYCNQHAILAKSESRLTSTDKNQ